MPGLSPPPPPPPPPPPKKALQYCTPTDLSVLISIIQDPWLCLYEFSQKEQGKEIFNRGTVILILWSYISIQGPGVTDITWFSQHATLDS